MVFFVCNSCGVSLKKSQVEKHYTFNCKSCNVLSCMDCGKDFVGEAYKEHTKCITEAQKYSGKDFQPKPGKNKGKKKQQTWLQCIQSVKDSPNLSSSAHSVLKLLLIEDNIPRKKNKFENLLRNKKVKMQQKDIDEMWELLTRKLQVLMEGDMAQTENSQTAEDEAQDKSQAEKKLSKKERKAERRKKQMKVEKKDAHVVENGEEEQTKKKKKQKHTDGEAGPQEKSEDVQGKNRKRKHEEVENTKKKKVKHCKETQESLLENAEVTGTVGEPEDKRHSADKELNQEETTEVKKKKKRKAEDENDEAGGDDMKLHEGCEEGGRKKKRRKQGGNAGIVGDQKSENDTVGIVGDEMPASGGPGKFKWGSIIKQILKSAAEGEMSFKKLRKKAVAEFVARGGDGKGDKSMEEIWAVFNKKVTKNPEFKYFKDRVKLVK